MKIELTKDPERWDSFAAKAPQGHFLQSYGWGEFKGLFGWQAERLILEDSGRPQLGAQVLYRSTPLGSVAYVPRGPVGDLREPLLKAILDATHERAKKRGAVFLKVEPNVVEGCEPSVFRDGGFCPSPQTVQPKSTVIVDLLPDLADISSRQKQKTRYNIGLAARKGVRVAQAGPEGLPTFHQLLDETARRDSFAVRPLSYFQQMTEKMGENVRLFLASYEDQVLAGILVAAFGREAIYLYGASGNVHRNLMPNHLLQWEAMKWAKARGCACYDLWGVPPEAGSPEEELIPDEQKKGELWGVYRFKQGFGGRVVRYSGAFDYVYSPLRYRLWTTLVPRIQGARRGMGE